jgi:hypothetical protein
MPAFLALISFSLFFFKAGFGMPPPQQPTPGAYPPPHQATAQLSYPLNPGFAGQMNPPSMSQYPPYPSSNTSPYPPSSNQSCPGYPPPSQAPPYPPTHSSPLYPPMTQSSSPYPTSELCFPTPAPVSFAPRPQPYNPVTPAYVSAVGAGPQSMIQGGHSLNRAGSNVTHAVRSTYTKVRSMNC